MKKWIAVVLTMVLVFGCLSPVVSGRVELGFVAVNDTIPLTLPAGAQPFFSGGTLLVPHTAFTASGMECYLSYDGGGTNLALYNQSKRLTFDLVANMATDESGNYYPISAVVKNGYVFLPASFSAGYFGMTVSYIVSAGGYGVVRFTNGNQIYDNSLFIQRAENFINYKIEEITQPKPATPTPATKPQTQPEPEEEPEPEPEVIPATVYLGIFGGENLGNLPDNGQIFTIFLTADEILANGSILRQLAAKGHHLGIYAHALTEIQQANQAYLTISLPKSLLVLTDFGENTESFEKAYGVFSRPEVELTAEEVATDYESTHFFYSSSGQLTENLVLFHREETQLHPILETMDVELGLGN